MGFIRNVVNKSVVLKYIKLKIFNILWRKKNKHNYTTASNCFSIKKVHVGKGTYGELKIKHFGNINEKLFIGNYCSIAPSVAFLLGGEHEYTSLMTYPIKNKLIRSGNESLTKGPIFIEDDVWIGYGSIILSGVRIGQGAIIAAGSIVYKDVPSYAIYATNRIIKYRFNKELRDELCKIDFSKIDYDKLIKLHKKYNEFKDVNINMINSIIDDIK